MVPSGQVKPLPQTGAPAQLLNRCIPARFSPAE